MLNDWVLASNATFARTAARSQENASMCRILVALVCTLALACADSETPGPTPTQSPTETQTPTPGPGPGPQTGTETNVAPAPCDADVHCGTQGRCLPLPGAMADAPKFCSDAGR